MTHKMTKPLQTFISPLSAAGRRSALLPELVNVHSNFARLQQTLTLGSLSQDNLSSCFVQEPVVFLL